MRAVLLASGAAGVAGVSAQSRWMHSLTLPMEFEYDSNPGMAAGPAARGASFLRLTPSLSTKYVHGTEEYMFDAALTAEKSSNTDVAQDRLDPSLRAAWKHVDELNTTEVAAVLDRRAFRDLDLQRQVPLGVDGSRTLFALTGSWMRDLDARTTFNADVRQEWERYSSSVTPDFSRTTAAARIKRAHAEGSSWYAGVNGQVFRPDDSGTPPAAQRSTVVGAVLGLDHAFSEKWRVDANAGPARFTQPTGRTDWQGGVLAEYTGQRWQGTVEALRVPGVNSTGGGLVVSEELRMRVRYDLDAVSRLEAEAGGAREKAARSNRTLASVAWVRQLSAAWTLQVKGTAQRQEGPGGTARSNRIGVMLVYSAPDL